MKALSGFLLPVLLIWVPCGGVLAALPPINTVFVIMLENYGWSSIKGSTNAPFINNVLLPRASYCEQYFPARYYNPSNTVPYSLPSYIWLEAGTNYTIWNNDPPSVNHLNVTNHLVTLLRNAGISWKAYMEDVPGTDVPLGGYNHYAVRHDPFVYFDDVTGTNNSAYPYGIAHIRPYTELASDLTNGTLARYNFIKPNLCDDMHDNCGPLSNNVAQGDTWLSTEVPRILNSSAFTNGGALFITWDDGGTFDIPIGMILLSPLAKGNGYVSTVPHNHSSTLRTIQEIFGVMPLLGDTINALDLSELFHVFEISSIQRLPDGTVRLTVDGVTPGKTNVVLASTNLTAWTLVSTNVVSTNTFTTIDGSDTNAGRRFYRVVQMP